ncbi:MAG TPA: hypothetical protein DEA69_11915, partial [Microbacterium sp.]|nr:hypothetical protein [Microbacterium sp.]
MAEKNWAGNLTYRAAAVREPASLRELSDIVARTPGVRALGSRHSFSPIADTDGTLVSLARMPHEIEVDTDAATARVSAGLRHGDLVPALD